MVYQFEKICCIGLNFSKLILPFLQVQVSILILREAAKRRKSKKWKKLNKTFKRLKKKSIKKFYSKFVNDLKQTNPGKWYEMVKRIGAVDQMNGQE